MQNNILKEGDIILVHKFYDYNNEIVLAHPFIVINTEQGIIHGLNFDYMCIHLGSFKNEEHKKYKLNFEGNVELNVDDGMRKDGYACADQLIYFEQDNLQYTYLGEITDEAFERIVKRIFELEQKNHIAINTNNLKNNTNNN